MTTLNIPASSRVESQLQEYWKEARSVFPIYLALAKQLEIEIPIPQAKRNFRRSQTRTSPTRCRIGWIQWISA